MDCYDPSTKSVPFMVLKSYGRTGSVKIPYIFFNLYMCIRLCQYFLTNRISSNYHQFISRYNEWNLLKPYKIVQKKQQLYPFNIKMIPKLLKKGGGDKMWTYGVCRNLCLLGSIYQYIYETNRYTFKQKNYIQ